MTAGKSFLLSKAVWLFGPEAEGISVWIKEQVAVLVEKLCGAAPKFSNALPEENNGDTIFIVVGTVSESRYIRRSVEKGLIDISDIKDDDYPVSRRPAQRVVWKRSKVF